MNHRILVTGLCLFLVLASLCRPAAGGSLETLIGPEDALLVTGPQGAVYVEKNAQVLLVPASILKVLTSLVAFHYLGDDFRFQTRFYRDPDRNLLVKGYGDPLFTSEALKRAADELALKMDRFHDLVLDDSYFDRLSSSVPGTSVSAQPYDAPTGALCANFNTVFFEPAPDGRGFVSAEPQTPLLPFALQRIRAGGWGSGRVVFSHRENELTLYTGHLLQYFLAAAAVESAGGIRVGLVDPARDTLVYTYVSDHSLTQVVAGLLEHSNNFIANQLLMAVGARVFGPPATLTKGVEAAMRFAHDDLGLTSFKMVEGSGISRRNRMSASDMERILQAFEPYRHLMRASGCERYKTGTLTGIRNRAGYITTPGGELYRFVVILNTSGKITDPVMERLKKRLGCREP